MSTGMKTCQATNGFLNEEIGPGNLYRPGTCGYQDANIASTVVLPGVLQVSC